ncbi:DgyrCDS6888 [Dimorphilus gyrociliatus]|uniref:Double zinc ribbon and ankyrin repeat-containing protein 1 n=2 Tax=Dimorphilus gyrociliatus TaxID=2664684 RepID=A0A7I8VPD1_9ANNE|nr:DgyrCDS6888 [Dimorphilus gyrociliatus]
MTAGAIGVPTVIPLRVPIPGQVKNSVDTNTKIELRSETANATIYYTINGDKPEPFQTLGPAAKKTYKYKVPFKLPAGKKTVKAIAVSEDGLRESHVVMKNFDVEAVPIDPDEESVTNGLEFMNELVGNDTARREVRKFAGNMVDSRTAWQEVQKMRENEEREREIQGSTRHKVIPGTRFMNDRMTVKSDKATIGQSSLFERRPMVPDTSTQAMRLQRETDFLKCIYCYAPRPADPFARFCNECGNPVAQITPGRLPPPEAGQMGTCVSCHSFVPFNTTTCVICEADIPPQNQPQASIRLADKLVCTTCGTANPAQVTTCVTCETRLPPTKLQNNIGMTAPPMPKSNTSTLLTCTKCGRANTTDARYCDWCGAKPSASVSSLTCSKCGASNYAYAAFCSSCGVSIEPPQRPDVVNNGLTIKLGSTLPNAANGSAQWMPVALPTNLAHKNTIATQTVGLFYPSEKELLKKQKEELEKLVIEKNMRDKNPVLTAVSPGRGYWRKQMDHICGHLKAHAQNNAEFRSLIAEPRMGKIVSTSVREDGYELSLTVSFALRTDADPFQGKRMDLKNSQFLSSYTQGGRASLRSYNSEDSLISHTSSFKGARKKPTKKTVKNKKVERGDKTMLQLLRELGKNGEGRPSEIEQLIEEGADPNGTNKDGVPVLQVAVKNSHTDAIPVLIDSGADVNKKGPNKGNTALHEAVLLGIDGLRVIDVLLKHGAKLERKNDKNETAYDLAVKSNSDRVARKLQEKMGQNALYKLSKPKSALFDDEI